MNNIVLLGLVSFFSDVSSEMVYPIIPLYLVNAFGSTPSVVGLIEGVAESLACILKVIGGRFTDKTNRKKLLAFAGYAGGFVYKAALIFSRSWQGVFLSRIVDRFGKGIRTAPRDVLVADSAGSGGLGRAFGLHKAMDKAGSALGILLAFLLVRNSDGDYDYKRIFLFSAIPAIIGLIVLSFVRETGERRVSVPAENLLKGFQRLDRRLKYFLLITFVFNLGNSSNAFLLLRAQSAGFSPSSVILLYFLYSATASLLSFPLGRFSDKTGRKKMLTAGYLFFSAVYLGFAVFQHKALIIALFVVYGAYTALTMGIERAFVAEISPKELKGTMLGLQSAIVGVALLPASSLAGLLYKNIGPAAPFYCGSVLAVAAGIGLLFAVREKTPGAAPDERQTQP